MLQGFARWPYAPIREAAGHYIDKRGHSFTADEFHQFQSWERISSLGAVLCIVAFAASWAIGWLLRDEEPAATAATPLISPESLMIPPLDMAQLFKRDGLPARRAWLI